MGNLKLVVLITNVFFLDLYFPKMIPKDPSESFWDFTRSNNDFLSGKSSFLSVYQERDSVLQITVSISDKKLQQRKRSGLRLKKLMYIDSSYSIGFEVFIPSDWVNEIEPLQQKNW